MVGFKIKVGIDYRQVVPWYLLPDVALFSLVTCHDVSHTNYFYFLFPSSSFLVMDSVVIQLRD